MSFNRSRGAGCSSLKQDEKSPSYMVGKSSLENYETLDRLHDPLSFNYELLLIVDNVSRAEFELGEMSWFCGESANVNGINCRNATYEKLFWSAFHEKIYGPKKGVDAWLRRTRI